MTKKLDLTGLKSIADNYDLFYIDLWGVIHNGIKLYDEAINVLKEISKKAKRIDLSVGSSTEKEISNALKCINKNCEVWIMYGMQLFPTDPKSLNLKHINYLKKKYKLPVGYQDHSSYDISGYTIPATAIGLGINIIEKHVTDSNLRNGTDGESAIEIKNYKIFVQKCNEAYESIGVEKKKSFNKKIYKIF